MPPFSPEERGGMQAIASHLEEKGYGTFLPQRDGLEPIVLPGLKSPLRAAQALIGTSIDRSIFALDVFQLVERCDALVFNMNGRTPDEGAVAESAMAFAVGRPVIIYKDDARSTFNGMDNSMVSELGSGFRVDKIEDIPPTLEKAQAQIKGGGSPSAELQAAVDLGRRIWQLLQTFRGDTSKTAPDSLAADIAKLVKAAV